ncbi:MAG: hypothetical protein CO187_10810 [Zetaproteobacteria bacterium CG_4_9_14_3_um_filter_53_7]|nr:MAG: hypothetical protein CO187_10810 [Zetaproteobacteria bacterium CG_4_9_14_3_um_filter_53_7]
MKSLFTGFILTMLLFTVSPSWAADVDSPMTKVGMLSCKILPHTGINLLVHSTRDIRCEFTSATGGSVERYKGETGIGFGLDVAIGKRSSMTYSILARHFTAGANQLAGKYSGASGSATLGVSAGDSAPIEKDDGTIALQPIRVRNQGAGVSLGFSYIYLEPDSQ